MSVDEASIEDADEILLAGIVGQKFDTVRNQSTYQRGNVRRENSREDDIAIRVISVSLTSEVRSEDGIVTSLLKPVIGIDSRVKRVVHFSGPSQKDLGEWPSGAKHGERTLAESLRRLNGS